VRTRSGSGYGPVEDSCEHGNQPSGSHKMFGSSWIAAQLAASQEGLCYDTNIGNSDKIRDVNMTSQPDSSNCGHGGGTNYSRLTPTQKWKELIRRQEHAHCAGYEARTAVQNISVPRSQPDVTPITCLCFPFNLLHLAYPGTGLYPSLVSRWGKTFGN
jgi:hypothetical protein